MGAKRKSLRRSFLEASESLVVPPERRGEAEVGFIINSSLPSLLSFRLCGAYGQRL